MTEKKIKTRIQLKKILSRLKAARKKIVFTNGCFDILHRGHVSLLEKAKGFGDVLVVAVNTDSSVRKIKGSGRPLNSLSDRLRVLAAIEAADYVTWFAEKDPARIIKELRPDVIVKGGDWRASDIVGREFVRLYGGRVKTVPYVKGCSTTSFIAAVRSGKK
jgi:rfaE bifunctional protein nucleotidyltransferase chain/domain